MITFFIQIGSDGAYDTIMNHISSNFLTFSREGNGSIEIQGNLDDYNKIKTLIETTRISARIQEAI